MIFLVSDTGEDADRFRRARGLRRGEVVRLTRKHQALGLQAEETDRLVDIRHHYTHHEHDELITELGFRGFEPEWEEVC